MRFRLCLRLIPVIALLLFAVASCAPVPPGPETQAPATIEAPASSEDILFFTWAEDDFEQSSLNQLAESFETTQGIRINLVVVR
jgi:ABC-type glycerol-3-phosphate transport system substrate-binding protein